MGGITAISREYGVSRPFVYDAVSKMKENLSMTFGQNLNQEQPSVDVQIALEHILSLRLEGGQHSGNFNGMKRFGLCNGSIGFIANICRMSVLYSRPRSLTKRTLAIGCFCK
jgi:hypothetical protein